MVGCALVLGGLAVLACQGEEQAASSPDPIPAPLPGGTSTPPPLGLQGLVGDMEIHLQDFTLVAQTQAEDARELVLRVQYMFLDPLLRFYGPAAEIPGGREVAQRVEELEELILSLRRTMETPGTPNPDRIAEITQAIEAKLRSIRSAAEEAGIRPPIEEGR